MGRALGDWYVFALPSLPALWVARRFSLGDARWALNLATHLAASALYRVNEKPYLFGSLATLWGWLKSALQRKPRYDDVEFRKFLRRYQRRSLLFGKKRAIEEIHRETGIG